MIGTIRTFDPKQREQIIAGMRPDRAERRRRERRDRDVQSGSGRQSGQSSTIPSCTEKMVPTLMRVAGAGQDATDGAHHRRGRFRVLRAEGAVGVLLRRLHARRIRIRRRRRRNHSDYFYVDEKSIPMALRAMTQMAHRLSRAASVTGAAHRGRQPRVCAAAAGMRRDLSPQVAG